MKKFFVNKSRTSKSLIFACLVTMVFAFGCTSVPLKISTPARNKKYEKLGEGTGSATGIMLMSFIPIMQNTRFERAYNAAVDSKNGDALINPVVKEKWTWCYVLNLYTTTVTGEVIKYVD